MPSISAHLALHCSTENPICLAMYCQLAPRLHSSHPNWCLLGRRRSSFAGATSLRFGRRGWIGDWVCGPRQEGEEIVGVNGEVVGSRRRMYRSPLCGGRECKEIVVGVEWVVSAAVCSAWLSWESPAVVCRSKLWKSGFIIKDSAPVAAAGMRRCGTDRAWHAFKLTDAMRNELNGAQQSRDEINVQTGIHL